MCIEMLSVCSHHSYYRSYRSYIDNEIINVRIMTAHSSETDTKNCNNVVYTYAFLCIIYSIYIIRYVYYTNNV